MRDIPVFATELGVASLTLSQIPYLKKAYIRIQSTLEPEAFLQECVSFCTVAGAEQVYCTGHEICEQYPEHTKIIKMRGSVSTIGETDAALFPLTEQTLNTWLSIYNQKIVNVPNGAWMTMEMGKELLRSGGGYFIHRGDDLLGIGKITEDQICWIASVLPGAGADVIRALCHGIFTDTVTLEVASENKKAMALYEKLGFFPIAVISQWYFVKNNTDVK